MEDNKKIRVGLADDNQDFWDVVSEYQAQYPDKVHKYIQIDDGKLNLPENREQSLEKVAQKPASPAEKKTFDRKEEKITVDKQPSCAYSDVGSDYQPSSPEEALLLSTLGAETWQIDALIAALELPAAKVLSLLTLLEIKGIVSRLPGRQVSRKNKP